MVGYFDYKQRCLIEKNVPIAFILQSRWQNGAESLGMEHTSCLWQFQFIFQASAVSSGPMACTSTSRARRWRSRFRRRTLNKFKVAPTFWFKPVEIVAYTMRENIWRFYYCWAWQFCKTNKKYFFFFTTYYSGVVATYFINACQDLFNYIKSCQMSAKAGPKTISFLSLSLSLSLSMFILLSLFSNHFAALFARFLIARAKEWKMNYKLFQK